MADRTYSEQELGRAIAAIDDPERLARAQSVVIRIAPALDRILGQALFDGGWFEGALEGAIRGAIARDTPDERSEAVRALLVEEARLGMLVGVAVGIELAGELGREPKPEEQ